LLLRQTTVLGKTTLCYSDIITSILYYYLYQEPRREHPFRGFGGHAHTCVTMSRMPVTARVPHPMRLQAAGHALLGNQLLLALSVAVLAHELQRRTNRRVLCHVGLTAAPPLLQRALPSLEAAIAPCKLTSMASALSNSTAAVRVKDGGPTAAQLTTRILKRAWRQCDQGQHQIVNARQLCSTAGAFRLAELPSSLYWQSMRARAERFVEPPREAHGGRHAVCLHMRGRDVEKRVQHLDEGVRIARGRATAWRLASRVFLAAPGLRNSTAGGKPAGAATITVAYRYPQLLAQARNSSSFSGVHLRPMPTTDEGPPQPFADLIGLSRCETLLPEEPLSRSTFTLVAALMGGLRPCERLGRRLGAKQPWRVLCRNETALLKERLLEESSPVTTSSLPHSECSWLGSTREL